MAVHSLPEKRATVSAEDSRHMHGIRSGMHQDTQECVRFRAHTSTRVGIYLRRITVDAVVFKDQ